MILLLRGRGGRGVRALEARLDHRPREVREEVHVALPHPVPPQEVAERGVRQQARGDLIILSLFIKLFIIIL